MAAKEEQSSTADVKESFHAQVGASSSEQNCKPNNCNSATMGTNNTNIPPPLKFIDIDINERLPRPTSLSPSLSNLSSIVINDELPTKDDIHNNKDLATQATQLIHWAISSKHKYYNKEIHNVDNTGLATSTNSYNPSTATKEEQIFHQKQLYAHTQFQSLMQLLLNKSNTPLLHYTLNALVSANSGRYLDLVVSNIASNSQLHAQLIHLLMIFNPFCPPQVTTTTVPGILGKNGREKLGKASVMNVGIEKLRELDMVRKERRRRNELLLKREEREAVVKDEEDSKVCPTVKSELERCNSPEPTQSQSQESILRAKSYSPHRTSTTKKKKSIKLSESSLQHKENIKYITPTIPYYNYSIANVYIHLLVTLVGNNTLLSVSAVRSLWKLLVDFGMEWKGWWMEYKEMEKSRVDRERRRKDRESRLKEEEQKKFKKEGEPAEKKIKIEAGEQEKKTPTTTSAQKQTQKEDKPQSEIDKSTPGMSGLSIDFIRNAFAYSMYHKEGYDDYEFGDDYGEHKYAYQASDLVMREEEIYHDRMANGRVRRLLLALVNIFRLCPRAKSDLQREMQSNFPHHLTTPPIIYSWYIHMCLQIVHIVPTFEGPTLTLFIDKALDMDVEIKVNNKGLVMLDSTPRNDGSGDDGLPPNGGVKQELFKGQGEASPSPMTPSLSKKRSFHQISNESLVDITPKSNKDLMLENETEQILEISERLDILMVALYQHIIKVTTFDAESLSSAITAVINARRLYRHLDGVFDKKVRTTDRSKFVQFIFLVLFGRENDALEVVGRLMAKREDEQYEQQLQQQQLQQQEQQRRQRSNSKDMVQTMKDIAMEPDMIPSAPINVTDPLYRGFSAKLIDLFFNPSYAGDVPRQTVVCYLASFVSRATYVCPETVCECLAALLRWAEVYIEAQPASVLNASTPTNSNVRRISSSMSLGGTTKQSEIHALFYTACQAAFYIMCFRGAEALSYYRKALQHKDDPETPYADPDSVDISAGRWKFLCGHTLQPLKYCLESVRLEFLHLAEDLDVFHESGDDSAGNEDAKREETKKFLEALRTTSSSSKGKEQPKKSTATPKRRRSTIISTAATQEKKRLAGGVGGLGRGSNPLNSFFPFDPYLLQKSYTHVHPYYRNWEDCILTMEDDKVENHEEEAVEYDEDAESGVSDLDDEEEGAVEEDSDDEEDDDDDDEEDEDSKQSTKPSPQLLEEPNLSMEIRRSRAMSTGSQASW